MPRARDEGGRDRRERMGVREDGKGGRERRGTEGTEGREEREGGEGAY